MYRIWVIVWRCPLGCLPLFKPGSGLETMMDQWGRWKRSRGRRMPMRALSWALALSLLVNFAGPIGYAGSAVAAGSHSATVHNAHGDDSPVCPHSHHYATHDVAKPVGSKLGFRPHCALCLFVLLGSSGLAPPVWAATPLLVPALVAIDRPLLLRSNHPGRRIARSPLVPRAPPGLA